MMRLMKKRLCRTAFAVIIALLTSGRAPTNGQALEVKSFEVANMSPIVQIYGLPRLNDAEIAAPANVDVHLGLSIVSNYSTDTAGTESIILDGETYRYDLTVRRGKLRRPE